MRLYVTPSGQWAGTQADAKELAREHGTGWEQRDVPTDKDGLLTFLNAFAVDAMHGEAKAMIAGQEIAPENFHGQIESEPRAGHLSTYSDLTLSLDTQWEALPLARKLHFAALAMEDAREVIERA